MSKTSNWQDRNIASPMLRFLVDFASLVSKEVTKIPADYRDQVLNVKQLLKSDISGMVNTIMGLAINSAAVNYRVETSNETFTKRLNIWLDDVNKDLAVDIPGGIQALSKEYFRERWQGSSLLALRTLWHKKSGWWLPTKMWFVDGEDVRVKKKSKIATAGGKTYFLIVKPGTPDSDIKLPKKKNETLYVRKPYDSWSSAYSTPFMIRRGIYQNLKFLELLVKKGEKVVASALEYLMMMKKGNAALAANDITYGKDDLIANKDALRKFIKERNSKSGTDAYVTQFDTEIEHIIPEYERALRAELSTPIIRRLMFGLGLLEIIEGTASNRKESVKNPKALASEVMTGVGDFASLIKDVAEDIKDRNKNRHKLSNSEINRVSHDIIKDFITKEDLEHIRSAYDRGINSKEGYANVIYVPGMDFDTEVKRRKDEKEKGYDKILFPPVTQNNGQFGTDGSNPVEDDEGNTPDKKGVEKKNFDKSHMGVRCPKCDEIFIYETEEEVNGKVKCPNCDDGYATKFDLVRARTLEDEILEVAPYTPKKYPKQIEGLPKGARSIWIDTFNAILKETKDEDSARKGAWRNVKLKYRKNKDGKWVSKNKAEVERALKELEINELGEVKELNFMGKHGEVLETAINNKAEETAEC